MGGPMIMGFSVSGLVAVLYTFSNGFDEEKVGRLGFCCCFSIFGEE